MRSLVQTLDTLVDGFASLPAPVQQSIVLMAALVGGSVAVHKAMGPLNSSSSQLAQTLGLIADPGQRLIGLGSGIASAFQTWGATFGSAESQINTFGTTISRSQGIMAGFKNLGSGIVSVAGRTMGHGHHRRRTRVVRFRAGSAGRHATSGRTHPGVAERTKQPPNTSTRRSPKAIRHATRPTYSAVGPPATTMCEKHSTRSASPTAPTSRPYKASPKRFCESANRPDSYRDSLGGITRCGTAPPTLPTAY